MTLLRLFWEFFKTGLFSVGGGMATLPFLYEISNKTGWFTNAQLTDMIAVSESTPGPMGVNMATYVGMTTAGLPGAIVATLGLITPEIIVILIIAKFFKQFRQNPYVDAAFYGLRSCSIGLIIAAGLLVFKVALLNVDLYNETGILWDLINIKSAILFAALFVVTRLKQTKKLHPVVFIAVAAIVGIVIF